MQAEHEQAGEQQRQAMQQQPRGADQHDADFNGLDDANDDGLVELVGELSCACRKQQKRKNEYSRSCVGQQVWIEAGIFGGVIRHQDDECILVDIVVERAEKLRQEEREETPLTQQLVLTFFLHLRSITELRDFSVIAPGAMTPCLL
jgi:preprotein translocase subunit YajC